MAGAKGGLGLEIHFGKLLDRLQFVSEAVREAAEEGMAQATMQLYNDAVMESPTVPKLTGHLRASGSALVDGNLLTSGLGAGEDPGDPITSASEEKRRGSITGTVGFNAPQAARLHEHPEYRFTEPGSGGKFLETKIAEHGREYMDLVAEAIRKVLGGG